MRSLAVLAVAGAVGMVVLGGCVTDPVGPVRDAAAFQDKATTSAEAAASAVATGQLAASLERDGKATGPYAEQLVDDALGEARTAQDTFEAITPPDDESRRSRDETVDALAQARRALSDELAAMTGDDEDGLTRATAELDAAADRLRPLTGKS